ncbi:2-amino-4-hydroxy-6-hydroxymethyldihydropteridine diphosphokinase [Longimicrobium sp.]|uniref:2-amino-4-hydroxy-6- hydroxymethyldihydropteridine diphosphokinase n=1 Tax=Longimicrobium sp. TaxID=2029185 RepID=UPI002CE0E1E2|nr:2-amino-4-hydroxy-6-hydroxymethyldihydropteridine diphosphokinase [Longimicrobium sp.]HSU17037.1 2-amino-4-hydroxy-6-hydroxymethyldihydropteridine diphosphokinase [Longimicrobium sp.]
MAGDAHPPVEVLLGLGANLGDPRAQLARAVDALHEFVTGLQASSIYRTEPVGHRDQPDFYNQVVRGTTTLSPGALLDRVLAVEEEMGRRRTFRNAPRVIDIDILAYGDEVIRTERLTVPHPGIAERGFVLHPLAEVAPGWRHPERMQTAREMLSAAALERVEKI